MEKFLNQFKKENIDYFNILSKEIPEWIFEYACAPEMKRLNGIGMVCGTNYSPIYSYKGFNSVLSHSIGVALIIWNFTHDKKQTLSGLFHDIATPTFKHCIDFMNGDSETQESTEEKTEEIISNSEVISKLLKRDKININEISDYHMYPIADNDTPRLSADRFEYTMSNAIFLYGTWNLDDIKKYYDDIIILSNEDNIEELAFKTKTICEDFVRESLPVFATYDSDNNRTVMQFIADILKLMNQKKIIKIDDLYILSEEDVINAIKNCNDNYIREKFNEFQKQTSIIAKDEIFNDNNYCISVKGKKRFIVPLIPIDESNKKGIRITKKSNEINELVEEYKKLKRSKYTGFNFEF